MTEREQQELVEAMRVWRHDVRDHIGAISGGVELLKRLGPLTEQQQRVVEHVLDETQRTLDVLQRMSVYVLATGGTFQASRIDIRHLIDAVQKRLSPTVSRLGVTAPERPLPLLGNLAQLTDALRYLIYPEDAQRSCTNPAPSLALRADDSRAVDVRVISALRVPPEREEELTRLMRPGSCLHTALVLLHNHGSTVSIDRTEAGVLFSFALPTA